MDPQAEGTCRTVSVTTDGFRKLDAEDSVTKLTSFDGQDYLRRGVRLSKILKGGGRIFRDSKGSASTYALSAPVDSISYFISHNWQISRGLKYIALNFKFNLNLALVAGPLLLIACTVLGMLGLMPTVETAESGVLEGRPVGFICRILIIPTLFCSLFFSSHFLAAVRGRHEPVMFLDKACIHQVDAELQRAGITKLGAFLRDSDKMLVLLSSCYLKRVWTVYEVASFLSMHELSQLEVVPVMLPFCFALFIILMQLYHPIVFMIQVVGLPDWALYLCNSFGSICYFITLRLWARKKAEIEDSIKHFTVKNAACEYESDREVIYQNIAALQRASGCVPRTATEAEALEALGIAATIIFFQRYGSAHRHDRTSVRKSTPDTPAANLIAAKVTSTSTSATPKKTSTTTAAATPTSATAATTTATNRVSKHSAVSTTSTVEPETPGKDHLRGISLATTKDASASAVTAAASAAAASAAAAAAAAATTPPPSNEEEEDQDPSKEPLRSWETRVSLGPDIVMVDKFVQQHHL